MGCHFDAIAMLDSGQPAAMMDEVDAIANAPLRATLFGDFRLARPGGEEIVISGKRAQALLAILCLESGVAVDRDRLYELLWRGRFRAQTRASLRQTLLGLKKLLTPIRPDLFAITRDRVAINATAIRSDLAEPGSPLDCALGMVGSRRACTSRSRPSRQGRVDSLGVGNQEKTR